MLTRLVRIQVLLFAVIALTGVGFVGAKYAGLDALVGGNGYVVKLRMPDSGGIFTHAEVTYRGVAVGRVGELRLIPAGVEVDLRLDDDAPPVPADVVAVVANRSAAGEQYVDLRPRRSGEPFLAAGAVIEQERTFRPLPVETVVLNLDRLVGSVPPDDLRVVVDEVYNATLGTAEGFQNLLDAAERFTKKAAEHLPQTTRLISDAGAVLKTQLEVSDALRSFAADAKLIAAELKKSDGDIRNMLDATPAAAGEVHALIKEAGPGLGALLTNMLTTSSVLLAERDGLERMLVVTPQVVSAATDVMRPDGARFGLATTFFSPPPCTRGYEGTRYRNALDTSDAPFNTGARCVR